MAEKMRTLEDLLHEQIQDLYSAEEQLIKAMPKMAKAASDKNLVKALEMHLKQTEEQKERLEKVADILDIKPGGHKCKAMEGLVKEGEEMMKHKAEPEVMDAGIIAAAQRIEHYEISGYGTAAHFCKELGFSEAEKILRKTLDEEKSTDEKLNKIAIDRVNKRAEVAAH